MNNSKSYSIKNSLKATKDRRASLAKKVYTLKLDKSHISKKDLNNLKLLFIEAKWFYNDILSSNNIFNYDTKNNTVTILDKNKNPVQKQLQILPSQVKQSIHNQLKFDILNLNRLKKSGGKSGKLKFKSLVNSVNLKQPNVTYYISGNRLKVQGFKKKFRIHGIEQLKSVVEFGEAKLVRSCDNYFLKMLCYEQCAQRTATGKTAGIDFGLKTNLTIVETKNIQTCEINNIKKYDVEVKLSKKLKKVQKGFSKKKKFSKNWYKNKNKLEKEHEKINNKKKDLKNKIMHNLKRDYDKIIIQDEVVSNWKTNSWNNRKIQTSCLGGIISELKDYSETLLVNRWYPSTKTCVCGKINNIGKSRTYSCSCGYKQDRDIHGATNILKEGIKIHLLRNEGDVKTSDLPMLARCGAIAPPCGSKAINQEATTL